MARAGADIFGNTALKGHYGETKFSGVLYSLQYIHKKINNIDI